MARFYTRIEPDPRLAIGYANLLRAIATFERKGRIADAVRARAVLFDVFGEMEALGVRGSAKADVFVRDRIRQTQVRPDASGRMKGSIQSRPLPTTFPSGSLGIADLDALDAGTINPSDSTQTPYWRAQESGTSAHVGRALRGYFMPGNANPSQAEFRNHPFFESTPYQPGARLMRINRPLRARHFLRDGARNMAVWHEAESARILGRAVSRLPRF